MGLISDFDTKYTLDAKPIGAGSFGQVYLGNDKVTGRRVAVKIYRHRTPALEVDQSFLRELVHYKTIAADPSIRMFFPKLYGYTLNPERIVIEKFDRTLSDLKIKTFKEFVKSARWLLRGLDALHQKGMYHRDIKPDNCLYNDSDERSVLGDLGSGRMLPILPADGSVTSEVTTLWWRAPEILVYNNFESEANFKYSPAMDVFSLGMTFLSLLKLNFLENTGHQNVSGLVFMEELFRPVNRKYKLGPYKDEEYILNLQARLTSDPKRAIRDFIGPDLKFSPEENELILELLEKMLTYDPEHRISAREALKLPIFYDKKINLNLKDAPIRAFHLNGQIVGTDHELPKGLWYGPYADHIKDSRYHRALEHKIDGNISNQLDINNRMLVILTDWLYEVGYKFNHNPDTMNVCVMLLLEMIRHRQILRGELQLLGTACLYVAHLYHETWTTNLNEYTRMCAGAYTDQRMREMVDEILSSVDLKIITTPTPIEMLRACNHETKYDYKQHSGSKYVLNTLLVAFMDRYSGMNALDLALDARAPIDDDCTKTACVIPGFVEDLVEVERWNSLRMLYLKEGKVWFERTDS